LGKQIKVLPEQSYRQFAQLSIAQIANLAPDPFFAFFCLDSHSARRQPIGRVKSIQAFGENVWRILAGFAAPQSEVVPGCGLLFLGFPDNQR